jgi:protein-S-isoprenylcysteine O-methyltransferase Ste14
VGLTPLGIAGRVVYAASFVVALPLLLGAWAGALEPTLRLPPWHAPWPGSFLATAGLLAWAAGVIEIVSRGGGLPMNAFPPPRLVTTGIYGFFRHPIYVGWVIACAGVSLATGSGAGLWIVTPAVALGCAALVIGLEGPSLRRRFPEAASFRPRLSLPRDVTCPPTTWERLTVWCLVLLPWIVVYQAALRLTGPGNARKLLWGAGSWAAWTWGDAAWASACLVVPLAVLLAPTRTVLRAFAVQGLVATVLGGTIVLCVPAGYWPTFRIVWGVLAAEAIATRSRAAATVAWAWAIGLTLSCLENGISGLAGALLMVLTVRRPVRLWRLALDGSERLANSWRAWRLGPIRVISHGIFAGAAAAMGLVGITALAGPAALPDALVVAVSALIGAALWAQWVEGSPRLLRPFGYYGSVVGALVGAGLLGAMGRAGAVVLAATAVVVPWVHAVGRLRCLVQGCCHGRAADPQQGIRVSNEHSRVVALAGLRGQFIHATQLYSIGGNLLIGVLLLRLWSIHAPIWFIVGAYLVLAGLARFMEEAYRGEPQTLALAGLPIYQHLAMISVLVGAWVTTLAGAPAPEAQSIVDAKVWAVAAAVGAVYWFAMGVDFPESQRRFARLSG